jgi:hypothetical protein
MFPVDKKASQKSLGHNVLIPWYPISYLTIASSVFLLLGLSGPYPTLRFGGACGLGVGAFDLAGPRSHTRQQQL